MISTPVGPLIAAATNDGVCLLEFAATAVDYGESASYSISNQKRLFDLRDQ